MSERECRPKSDEIVGQKLPYPASQADMTRALESDLSNYRPAGKLQGKVNENEGGIGVSIAVA